ncbi:MAG TPA: TraR/DksA family transcriptional regulator [Caldimonas sp.]|nr:TraR/DksA family transcriptional regulator [Caldimonas sp.]
MPDLHTDQLDTIRRLLDAREHELAGEVRDANRQADEAALGPRVGDSVDQGDERFQDGMAHAEKLRDQEELIAIDAARSRIAEGSYGECIDCGRAIPFERLRAQPTALRCVPCQAKFEKTHPAAPVFTV